MTTMVPNTSLLPFGRCRVPKTLFLSMALGVLFCSQLWILSDVDRVENGRGTKDTKTVRDRRDEDAAIVLEVLSQRSRRTKPRSQPSLSQPNEGGAEVVVGVSGSSATRVSSHSKATTTTTDGGDATAANIRSQSSSTSTEQETAVTTAAATPATTSTPSQSSAENTTTTHNQTMVSTPANNNKNNNTTKKLFRFMSSVMNFSCSAPYTLLPGSYPTPLNVSSFSSSSNGKDGRHITCSMGCTNVTLPNHFPSFIIIGSQKGGTSALYHYFSQLPTVVSSSTFEPHWFDMEARSDFLRLSPERLCQMRHYYLERNFDLDHYYRKVSDWHPTPIFTFEKTPAYLRSMDAAFYMHLMYPHIKLLAILRNPVTRTYSQYEMEYHRNRGWKIADSFQEWVNESVNSMRTVNLTAAPTLEAFAQARTRLSNDSTSHRLDFSIPIQSFADRLRIVGAAPSWHKHKTNKRMEHNTLYVGMYAVQLSQWLQYFELGKSIMVVQFEKFLANKTGVFGDICDFLGIPRGQLNESVLEKNYRPVKEKKFKKGVPIEPVDPLLNETREYLEHFFKPYNEELAQMLGKEWENVW